VAAENGKKHVTFRFHGPDAEKAFLAGDFNDWNAGTRALKRYEDGTWKTTISLMPGVYEYKFVIDGDWRHDPQCAESVENEFGSRPVGFSSVSLRGTVIHKTLSFAVKRC